MSINRHNRIVVIYSVTSLSNLWPECQKRAQLLHNTICVNVTDVETVSLLWLWFASRGRIETSEARNRSVWIWCVHSLTAKQSRGSWQLHEDIQTQLHIESLHHPGCPIDYLSHFCTKNIVCPQQQSGDSQQKPLTHDCHHHNCVVFTISGNNHGQRLQHYNCIHKLLADACWEWELDTRET